MPEGTTTAQCGGGQIKMGFSRRTFFSRSLRPEKYQEPGKNEGVTLAARKHLAAESFLRQISRR
jgi:hypothetical protein